MNDRVYLILPPNILRKAREKILRRFPETELDAPEIHAEMYAFASRFGVGPIPGLTVSAYPQILENALTLAKQGMLKKIPVNLSRLRTELSMLGMTPPIAELCLIGVVPAVLAASENLTVPLNDWDDLCKSEFPGPIGCPPADTPLPYLAEALLCKLFGNAVINFLSKADFKSNPLDLNKRIAASELSAALIIPAFARSFRQGGGRMVWPASGALGIPLMACLSADAGPVATAVLEFLLSEEFQGGIISDGGIAPACAGIMGFEELETNSWKLYWPGWELVLDVARTMRNVHNQIEEIS